MLKFIAVFAVLHLTWIHMCNAVPIDVEKSSGDDDMKTSETFGYGYYQPGLYSSPLPAFGAYQTAPIAAVGSYPVTAPLASSTALVSSTSSGISRSGYGYGSGYKYGGGYGYGGRWDSSSGNAVNQFYRHHPVYVAWG